MDRVGFGDDVNGILAGRMRRQRRTGASKEPDGNSSGAATTLRFATWDTGDALKIEQEIAKKFEESHPGTKVQVEAYADGFDQKLADGAANPPDVMYMGFSDVSPVPGAAGFLRVQG